MLNFLTISAACSCMLKFWNIIISKQFLFSVSDEIIFSQFKDCINSITADSPVVLVTSIDSVSKTKLQLCYTSVIC